MPSSTSIECLPDELLQHIAHLAPASHGRLHLVSRRFRQAVLMATTQLDLGANKLQLPEDLACLLRFRSLICIKLEACTDPAENVVAVSFLQFATQLRALFSEDLVDTVLPVVGRLTTLRELHLPCGHVKDLGLLAHLTALEELSLYGVEDLGSLQPITSLTGLRMLDLTCTCALDIQALAALTALTDLRLEETEVSDLSALANLTALRSLDIQNTPFASLEPLRNLTNLTQLVANPADLSSVRLLSGLTALKRLYLGDSHVSDLLPLAGLTNLELLSVWHTKVQHLEPLARLVRMNTLYLSDTKVSDISPLALLTNLSTLWLDRTGVSCIQALSSLTSLRYISLIDTLVRDLGPLACTAKPNCEVIVRWMMRPKTVGLLTIGLCVVVHVVTGAARHISICWEAQLQYCCQPSKTAMSNLLSWTCPAVDEDYTSSGLSVADVAQVYV